MLIEAVNITKVYGNETVIESASLGIKEGESLSITGLSGSGKTTLLGMLGTLIKPTEGEVLIRNERTSNLSDENKSYLRQNFIGFVFQNTQLISSLSVLDNVLVPSRFARRGNLRPKAVKILKELGLESKLNHLPFQLSVGQKRRAAIARAILLEPMVVLADEPTNDLDPGLAKWVGDFLFGLTSRGKSLVLVTHDNNLAGRADRVMRITEGRLIGC